MRLAWLTDIHLNFVNDSVLETFAREVLVSQPDAVLISGDIGESTDVFYQLERLACLFMVPIYYVLGNHDYYRGSIVAVRTKATELTRQNPNLVWLPAVDFISLDSQTALVGHDGWGDGGFGDAVESPIRLNDFRLIEELRTSSQTELLAVLKQLGEEAAEHFRTSLPAALREHEHVIAITHVPPFPEAACHNGSQCDADWLPYFACKASGEALREIMGAHPQRRLTVLCGHTHSSGECQVLPNLTVLTGGAKYGQPKLQRVLE